MKGDYNLRPVSEENVQKPRSLLLIPANINSLIEGASEGEGCKLRGSLGNMMMLGMRLVPYTLSASCVN